MCRPAICESIMAGTDATPEEAAEAVGVNTEARLRALKIGLLFMAGLALLAIIPARRLPNYRLGEIPGAALPARVKATR
jgi:hypothetical protein